MTTVASPSGWIGGLPGTWRWGRLGPLASVKARLGWRGLKAEEYLETGFIFLATPNIKGRDIDFENVNYIGEHRYLESPEIMLREGDVLLAKDGSTLGITNVVRHLPAAATVNSSLAVVRPGEELDGTFLYYFFQSGPMQSFIEQVKDGMGVPHLFQADIRKFDVPVPRRSEQRRIACFLDRKTATVDALVAKKERLIDLLQEKRQALVTHAVTKGLGPGMPMKESGLPSLGSIPATWTRTKVRRVCASLRDGTHTPPPREDGEYRLLSARNIKDGRLVLLDDDRTMREPAFRELERSYAVRPGDVVVTIVGATTGKCGIVYSDIIKSSVQRSVAILRPNRSLVDAEYLHLWVSGGAFQEEIQGIIGKYAAQPGIYLDEFASLPVLLPPLAEQQQILERRS